ncbi:MAG TPA: nucleotidyltransferase family protein [Bordetella sp.]
MRAGTVQASGMAGCMGILLAGGYGRRYAQAAGGGDKLLASLPDGRPVAQASAAAMLAVLPGVWAVVRPESQALAGLLAGMGCRVLRTGRAREGMGGSLAAAAEALLAQAGAAAALAPTHCLVALADMPWVAPASHVRVAESGCGHPIVAAACQGRRGHPVSFAAALWPELAALAGDEGARGLLTRHGVVLAETGDPGVLADIDQPADLMGPARP